MQIEIVSLKLDQVEAEYQALEAAYQALDQEFRTIILSAAAPAEPGSLTLIERLNAAIHDLPGVVIRRDEAGSKVADLQAFVGMVAARESTRQMSIHLGELNKRVLALSEEIQGKRGSGGYGLENQGLRHTLIKQYGSDLVNQIEERVKAQVIQPTGEPVVE